MSEFMQYNPEENDPVPVKGLSSVEECGHNLAAMFIKDGAEVPALGITLEIPNKDIEKENSQKE